LILRLLFFYITNGAKKEYSHNMFNLCTVIYTSVCVYMYVCAMKRSHLLSLYIAQLKITFTNRLELNLTLRLLFFYITNDAKKKYSHNMFNLCTVIYTNVCVYMYACAMKRSHCTLLDYYIVQHAIRRFPYQNF